jgi:hypothetical protein
MNGGKDKTIGGVPIEDTFFESEEEYAAFLAEVERQRLEFDFAQFIQTADIYELKLYIAGLVSRGFTYEDVPVEMRGLRSHLRYAFVSAEAQFRTHHVAAKRAEATVTAKNAGTASAQAKKAEKEAREVYWRKRAAAILERKPQITKEQLIAEIMKGDPFADGVTVGENAIARAIQLRELKKRNTAK